MSTYKRYVSYIYKYYNEIKEENVGFVKLEAKLGEVKLYINIKGESIRDCDLTVGLLTRNNNYGKSSEGQSLTDRRFIEIEKIRCSENEYSSTYRTSMTDVFNSGVSINDILGVFIDDNKAYTYKALWIEDTNNETMENVSNNEQNDIVMNQKVKNESNDIVMNLNDYNEVKIVHMDINEEDERKNSPSKVDKLAERILKNYPGMYPFEDDEIIECVKFEPHDIGMLSMDKWSLANNSFLLHGYYTYRHLIFAKMKYGETGKYVLGVPGIFRDRERFMAHMFGFRGFKGVRNNPLSTGEFGYWYQEIKL